MTYASYSIVFLTFVGIFSGTKFLDEHSQHYEACAAEWARQAEAAPVYGDADTLLPLIGRAGQVSVSGRPCPELLPQHKAHILRSMYDAV